MYEVKMIRNTKHFEDVSIKLEKIETIVNNSDDYAKAFDMYLESIKLESSYVAIIDYTFINTRIELHANGKLRKAVTIQNF